MWLSVDPLAGKYPSVSPYIFSMHNPVKYVDPDGKDIIILGSKEYIQGVVNYLAKLGSKSSRGAKLIWEAINSNKELVIFDPSNKIDHATVKNYNTDQGYETLGLDLNILESDNIIENSGLNDGDLESSPETILGHEISHFVSEDNEVNLIRGKNGFFKRDEVNAVREENQIRRELGMDERGYYDGTKVYGKKPKKYNSRYSTLTNDPDYSKNREGISKKTFQLLFKHYTKMKYENVGRKKPYIRRGKYLNRSMKRSNNQSKLRISN